jgi:hypothetical protein
VPEAAAMNGITGLVYLDNILSRPEECVRLREQLNIPIKDR